MDLLQKARVLALEEDFPHSAIETMHAYQEHDMLFSTAGARSGGPEVEGT